MKLCLAATAAIMAEATPLLASSMQEAKGPGLLLLLFLGFGSLIVLCQFIPAFVLFYAMLKGLFRGTATKAIPRTNVKVKTS
ncbi:MAG: hypothetical protein AB1558_06990 [Thermodesulfobacteriota bacterium]